MKEKLRDIIVNAIPITALGIFMGAGIWVQDKDNQKKINSLVQDVQAVYEKWEPTLREIQSRWELTAMAYSGVWDMNWKPYNPNSIDNPKTN